MGMVGEGTHEERVENHLEKPALYSQYTRPGSDPDLPVIGSVVYCEIDQAATEQGRFVSSIHYGYSSSMTSLVLTDSSQLTSDSQHLDLSRSQGIPKLR
uniref:Uncharacterized protein n=1 Tax=Timema genevievae TaxID=629358 RepID=A0A7R9K5G6_TIMGE|nr:unnamed protein product [Timema genevievae]